MVDTRQTPVKCMVVTVYSYGGSPITFIMNPQPTSDVLARLGLKAAALAWLLTAQAVRNVRVGQSREWWLALAWLRPKPWPVRVKCAII
jgi:hypothetical protein